MKSSLPKKDVHFAVASLLLPSCTLHIHVLFIGQTLLTAMTGRGQVAVTALHILQIRVVTSCLIHELVIYDRGSSEATRARLVARLLLVELLGFRLRLRKLVASWVLRVETVLCLLLGGPGLLLVWGVSWVELLIYHFLVAGRCKKSLIYTGRELLMVWCLVHQIFRLFTCLWVI